MAFSCKVDNQGNVVFAEYSFYVLVIVDIAAFEKIIFAAEFPIDVDKVHEVSGIGQFVVINERTCEVCFLKNIPDEIGPDKTGSSGHQDVRRFDVWNS